MKETIKTNAQKGFTLVELAIVMTIIGLLIGGILKGQELMMNARITATISQVRSYEAAATTFRDSFASLPGDMLNASTRLPGCTAACNPPAATGGNSIVGAPAWDWSSQWVALGTTNSDVGTETVLFWLHLLQADLISGVSSEAMTATAAQWGVTHPAARINGGFIVGFASGTATPGGGGSTPPTGMVLAVVNAPTSDLTDDANIQPMTAGRAAQLDRKMDDGRPASGFVQAYGDTDSCFTSATDLTYDESTTGSDCGVVIRIQG